MAHARHARAALVGIIGFLGSVSGLIKLPSLLAGGQFERPHAIVLQSIMAVLCLIFIGLCVKSFIRRPHRPQKSSTARLTSVRARQAWDPTTLRHEWNSFLRFTDRACFGFLGSGQRPPL